MANLRIDLDHPLMDGETVTFKAPSDCTAVSGVIIYYPNDTGEIENKTFAFKDSHNNTLTGLGNLFSAGALVSVLVNTTTNVVHILNADTNAYLENKIADMSSFVVGTYTGDADKNETTSQTISLGFKPSFVFVMCIDQHPSFYYEDTNASGTVKERSGVTFGMAFPKKPYQSDIGKTLLEITNTGFAVSNQVDSGTDYSYYGYLNFNYSEYIYLAGK